MKEFEAGMDRATAPGEGRKVVIQLFLTYFFFCKSLAYSWFVDNSWYLYMVPWKGVSAAETNDYFTVVRAPWAIKPLWAMLSDAVPIQGYRKRWYIVLSGVMATTALVFYLVFDLPVRGGVMVFFLFVASTSFCDSMTQARYTVLMNKANSASVVSFVWGLLNLGGLLSFMNYSIDIVPASFSHKILPLLALPMCVPFLYPAAKNWLAEPQEPSDCESIKANYKLFTLSIITATCALGGVIVQLNTGPIEVFGVEARWIGCFYYLGAAATCLTSCQLFLPKTIALPAIYMFLCRALYLNVGNQLQFYYTADANCFTNIETGYGPMFSLSYYNTASGYGGTIATLGGVALFDRYIQFWKVRQAFWVTTAVNCCTAVLDVMLIERWTQRMAGRDPTVEGENNQVFDMLFFVLGAQAIDRLVDMLDNMPSTVLIGKLCPQGMEAQVFSILAALSNFGSSIGYVNGSIVQLAMGITLSSSTVEIEGIKLKNFDCANPMRGPISSLGWLKLIGVFFLPLTTVPFTWVCLPDLYLDEDFHAQDHGVELEANGQQPADAMLKKSGSVALTNTAMSKSSLMVGRSGDFIL